MLKQSLALASAAFIGIQAMTIPAHAMSDEEKAGLAAAAILGIAALAHHQHHYREGAQTTDAEYKAMFERGYRDGLHNEPYDSRHSSAAYGQGYDAGHKERANRLSYKNQETSGTRVPRAALNSCISDAAAAMNVGGQDIHVIKAAQEGSDNFYIEVAAGHKHLVCEVNSQGQIFNTRYGTL